MATRKNRKPIMKSSKTNSWFFKKKNQPSQTFCDPEQKNRNQMMKVGMLAHAYNHNYFGVWRQRFGIL